MYVILIVKCLKCGMSNLFEWMNKSFILWLDEEMDCVRLIVGVLIKLCFKVSKFFKFFDMFKDKINFFLRVIIGYLLIKIEFC